MMKPSEQLEEALTGNEHPAYPVYCFGSELNSYLKHKLVPALGALLDANAQEIENLKSIIEKQAKEIEQLIRG